MTTPHGEGRPPPRVTVVIPTYDRAAAVVRAVHSVLEQTFDDLEVVVVDDGSEDDTLDRLRSIDDPRVRVLEGRHAGATAARNRGADAARGALLGFLDSDDTVVRSWLSRLVSAADECSAAVVTCGLVEVYERPEGDERGRVLLPADGGPALGGLVARMNGGTYLIDRALFLEVGGFDPEQRASQHLELALRTLPLAVDRQRAVAVVMEPLLERRIGAYDHIRRDDDAVLAGTLRLIEKHRSALRHDRSQYAGQLSTAAFRALRLSRAGLARRLLITAALQQPLKGRHWLRLGAATVAPGWLRRRWDAVDSLQ